MPHKYTPRAGIQTSFVHSSMMKPNAQEYRKTKIDRKEVSKGFISRKDMVLKKGPS